LIAKFSKDYIEGKGVISYLPGLGSLPSTRTLAGRPGLHDSGMFFQGGEMALVIADTAVQSKVKAPRKEIPEP
jgi:hypothetical protein